MFDIISVLYFPVSSLWVIPPPRRRQECKQSSTFTHVTNFYFQTRCLYLYSGTLCSGFGFCTVIVCSVYQCCPYGVCRSDNEVHIHGYFLFININSDCTVRFGTCSDPKTVDIAHCNVGRDNSVGIATRYGLDGPGIESRLGARFSAPAQTGLGAHPATCTMSTGSFPG